METSLRYGEDSKALRIHAKEKFPIDSNTYFQLHGELDTKLAQPTSYGAFVKRFYPNLWATLGVGLRYDKRERLRYTVNTKKIFSVPLLNVKTQRAREVDRELKELPSSPLNFKIKGACDVDMEFKKYKSRVAAEISCNLFNFHQDQDIRLRVGCEYFDKVPYLQIRENNWTINVDYNGRWNVRYDL